MASAMRRRPGGQASGRAAMRFGHRGRRAVRPTSAERSASSTVRGVDELLAHRGELFSCSALAVAPIDAARRSEPVEVAQARAADRTASTMSRPADSEAVASALPPARRLGCTGTRRRVMPARPAGRPPSRAGRRGAGLRQIVGAAGRQAALAFLRSVMRRERDDRQHSPSGRRRRSPAPPRSRP